MREKIRLYNKRENTALQWAGKYGFTMGGNQRPGKVLTKTNLYGSIIVKLLLILFALFMFDEISVNWEKYWTYTLQYITPRLTCTHPFLSNLSTYIIYITVTCIVLTYITILQVVSIKYIGTFTNFEQI